MAQTALTVTQRNHIFALLKQTNLTSQRANIIAGFTEDGSESINDLSFDEAYMMIQYLSKQLPAKEVKSGEKQRKKIISICYDLPQRFNFWNWKNGKKVFNAKGLDNWLLTGKKSPFKKRLNDFSTEELSKAIYVFEKIRTAVKEQLEKKLD